MDNLYLTGNEQHFRFLYRGVMSENETWSNAFMRKGLLQIDMKLICYIIFSVSCSFSETVIFKGKKEQVSHDDI